MQDEFVRALIARRREIHARWEVLLRIERVNTPLANPDALVFMIDWTLDEVFNALRHAPAKRRGSGAADHRPECPCGRNPLLVYFAAGCQALEEALVLVQAETAGLDPDDRDNAFSTLKLVMREISCREIESFCSICQYRTQPCPSQVAGAHAHAHGS
jgi:hypothetical protein